MPGEAPQVHGQERDPSKQLYALVVAQDGKAQRTLAKFLTLLINYRYGFTIETAPDFIHAAGIIRRLGRRIRCVFVIQSLAVSARTTVPALTMAGTIPLYLLLPGQEANGQRESVAGIPNVYVCPWEMAFASGEGSLQRIVGESLAEVDIQALLANGGDLAERLKERLDRLDTLPTLPAVVLHIMRVISDSKATVAQLEELLMRDTAIVLKVMQVANSPYFMGTSRAGQRWTLQEAIVRLGVKKVGGIAQQIALINTFVRPEESDFDIRRFWVHSVGCAMVADRLVEEAGVDLSDGVSFNDYWMAALLHDCGKVVQGFFFNEWYARIVHAMDGGRHSFDKAEEDLGGGISHEWIGELLLRKSNMPNDLMRAVGLHHRPGEKPSLLTALVHVADGMTKEMGLGLIETEPADYSRTALAALHLKREDVRRLSGSFAGLVKGEVNRLVKECMG